MLSELSQFRDLFDQSSVRLLSALSHGQNMICSCCSNKQMWLKSDLGAQTLVLLGAICSAVTLGQRMLPGCNPLLLLLSCVVLYKKLLFPSSSAKM